MAPNKLYLACVCHEKCGDALTVLALRPSVDHFNGQSVLKICHLVCRCYIALKRNHDNQKDAAAYLKKVLKIEKTVNTGVQVGVDSLSEVKEGEVSVERDEKEKEVGELMKGEQRVYEM